jgi:hypothetical protein
VWCDILTLEKGVDFWKDIEYQIRNNSCRFLYVLSSISNERQGVLNELAIAISVKNELNDNTFIQILRIDEKLSYSNMNIQINRLNTIDFTPSWATGLYELEKHFKDNNIPKNIANYDECNKIFHNIFLKERQVVEKEDFFRSNYFRIIKFPEYLYFHQNYQNETFLPEYKYDFPVVPYKNTLCSLSSNIETNTKQNDLFNNKIHKISIDDILTYKYSDSFIEIKECKRFIVQLLNASINQYILSLGLTQYDFSNNKIGFWFEKGKLPKDKINNEQMIGVRKLTNWHYCVGVFVKLYRNPVLIITPHIIFTTDGKEIIKSKDRQLKLMIRQGNTWHNNRWLAKQKNVISYIAKCNEHLIIPVGFNEILTVSTLPVSFKSDYSYILPKKNIHEENIDIPDDFEDIIEYV